MARRMPQPAARARVAVMPIKGAAGRGALLRLLPTGRSLVIGFGLVLGAAGLYALARVTPMFALQRIEVKGASPALGHASFFVNDRFSQSSNQLGIIQLQSSGGVTGVGQRFSPSGSFTSVPIVR